MNNNLNIAIGSQLKLARSNNGWSLDATCKKTTVSKAMLGQIERGESSPTIATLWKIAGGFHLPLSYFLAEIEENPPKSRVINNESGINISTLFPFSLDTKSEIFCLTLSPQHEQLSAAHNEGVIEHIVVIKGAMEYFLNGEWHSLSEGECVKFNAHQAHGYRNMTTVEAVFHNIIFYSN